MQWWGRERLAQTHMSWARQALSKGNRAMALWNVDMALSMVPQLEEAIRLKERLSGRPYWADNAQDSAIRYVIQRMIMQDLGKPVELVIPPGKPRSATDLDKAVPRRLRHGRAVELPLGEPHPSEKAAKDG